MTSKHNNQPSRRSVLQTIATVGLSPTIIGTTPALASNKDPDQNRIVHFGNLTPKARSQFLAALSKGQLTRYANRPKNGEATLADQLTQYLYVQYQGEVYFLNPYIAFESLYEIRISKADIQNAKQNGQTANYDELSTSSQRTLDAALAKGELKSRGDAGFPTELVFRYRQIKKDGELYDLNSVHGDIPVHTIRPMILEDG